MLQYNLIDTSCASVITTAEDYGVGILVGGPYKRGYLTGRFNTVEDLPTHDDYWKWNLDHNAAKVVRTLDAVDAHRKDSVDEVSFRRKALRFVVDHPGVSSAIVGHRSMAEATSTRVSSGRPIATTTYSLRAALRYGSIPTFCSTTTKKVAKTWRPTFAPVVTRSLK
jgi:hypothetical protein